MPCSSVGTPPVAPGALARRPETPGLLGGAGRAGLLPRQAEIADLYGMRRIAEVIDFGHAPRAPARHAGDQIGNSRVAFPPILVGVLQALADVADENGIGWI